MSNNYKCFACRSNHTRRCAMVYEQGYSTVYGPNFDTVRVNAMASRTSPPTPPTHPEYWRKRFKMLAFFGVPLVLLPVIAIVLCLATGPDRYFPVGALVPGSLGVYLLWHGWPPRGSLNNTQFNREWLEYQRNLVLYQRLWVCLDCGHIFCP